MLGRRQDCAGAGLGFGDNTETTWCMQRLADAGLAPVTHWGGDRLQELQDWCLSPKHFEEGIFPRYKGGNCFSSYSSLKQHRAQCSAHHRSGLLVSGTGPSVRPTLARHWLQTSNLTHCPAQSWTKTESEYTGLSCEAVAGRYMRRIQCSLWFTVCSHGGLPDDPGIP